MHHFQIWILRAISNDSNIYGLILSGVRNLKKKKL